MKNKLIENKPFEQSHVILEKRGEVIEPYLTRGEGHVEVAKITSRNKWMPPKEKDPTYAI